MLRRRLLQVAAARSPSDQVELTDRPSLLQVAPTPPPPPAPPPPGGQRPQKETPDLVVCLQQSQWWCCTALQQPAGTLLPRLSAPSLQRCTAQKSVFCNRPTVGVVLHAPSSSSAVCAHRVYLSVCKASADPRHVSISKYNHTDPWLVVWHSTVCAVKYT